MLSDDQSAMHVLATSHLQCWKNEGSVFLDWIVMVDKPWVDSFDAQLK